ncbi:mechanosensitive ion channel family protein [Heyndrickxia acidicola]|uniref:Mechanosensitive ion channel family protein n=1 Tax=Heyndrickxia acidicola TaxID=209389 RepID=A0ABU6MJR0_9BACI|nr:mechanosensitive ion channel family protein [Heyndrickxia acidicola]MED1204246.1 mechanosensitive ion channel family protein [Heyndrickxia acidicola]
MIRLNIDHLANFNWTGLLIKAGTIVLQIIVLYIIYLIIRSIGTKIIHTIFVRYQERQHVSVGRAKTLEHLVKNTFSYVLIFFFFVTALQSIGIGVTSILAGAGIVGLAVGFGAQGLVSDVVTGFFLLLEKQVDVDDYITVGNFNGIVEQVGLRTTQLRDFDGTLHFIPNRQITSLSNHSRGNMRALVDFPIDYNEDLDQAIQSIQNACKAIAKGDKAIVDGPHVLGVETVDSSKVVLRIIARTLNGEQWNVERRLKKVIKEALAQSEQEG